MNKTARYIIKHIKKIWFDRQMKIVKQELFEALDIINKNGNIKL